MLLKCPYKKNYIFYSTLGTNKLPALFNEATGVEEEFRDCIGKDCMAYNANDKCCEIFNYNYHGDF